MYSNCNELDVKGEIELNQQCRVEKVKTIIAELRNEKIQTLQWKYIKNVIKQNKNFDYGEKQVLFRFWHRHLLFHWSNLHIGSAHTLT